MKATDATYEGLYSYPPDAISPDCGEVILWIFSEKEPDKATSKVLHKNLVEQIYLDFEPWRDAARR